jgi:hypothetical protein
MFVQFTQVFRRRMREDYWLAIVKSVPTHIWEWTDGSGQQFKQRRAFADISDSPADLGYAVTRSYCESYHGKGPHDGAGACLKCQIGKKNLDSTDPVWHNGVHNALSFYQCAVQCFSEPVDYIFASDQARVEYSNRYFIYITQEEMLLQQGSKREVKPVQDTLKLHSVRSVDNPNHIEVILLSTSYDVKPEHHKIVTISKRMHTKLLCLWQPASRGH